MIRSLWQRRRRRALHLCPGPEGEILRAWTADLLLALRLRLGKAGAFAHDENPRRLRSAAGPPAPRPRPTIPGGRRPAAAAYALAAGDAHALAMRTLARAEKLLAVAPKLRAKPAARVVELLLTEDCVSPARAAKISGLSDRAARRLFDRLLELGALREISGRTSFRLYGL